MKESAKPAEVSTERRKPGRPRNDAALIPAKVLLLEETIKIVAEHGPLAVNARQICKGAGVMFAAVNYNFGSWNALLATAAAKVYLEYVEAIWQKARAAGNDPKHRLRAYIEEVLVWAGKMPGWFAVINYPVLVKDVTAIRLELFSEETVGYFLLNQARLRHLIFDIRQGKVSNFDFEANNLPVDDLIQDNQLAAKTVSIGWSIMGMAVWASRGTTGESQVGDMKKLEPGFIEFHIEQLLHSI